MPKKDSLNGGQPVNKSQAIRGLFAENPKAETQAVISRLAEKGVQVSPTMVDYVRQTARGRVLGQKPLTDEPVFREGLAIADELSGGGEAFVAVAGWSAEYQAINKAMNSGSRPEDLRCAPPVVFAEHDDGRA